MKIDSNILKKIEYKTLKDLSGGQTFLHNEDVYMKLDANEYSFGNHRPNVVSLRTGQIFAWSVDRPHVLKLKAVREVI